MAVAHIMSLGGAMSNPFEYREVMKAQFQLNTDKTVDQVQAEQEQRHRENQRRPARATRSVGPAEPAPGVIRKSEMEKLKEMLAKGKQNQPTTDE